MALRAEDGQVVMRGVSGSVCVYVKELEAEVRIVEREGQRGVFDAKHRFHEAKAMRVFRSHLGGCRHSLRARILHFSFAFGSIPVSERREGTGLDFRGHFL